jgi:hypothetical protein
MFTSKWLLTRRKTSTVQITFLTRVAELTRNLWTDCPNRYTVKVKPEERTTCHQTVQCYNTERLSKSVHQVKSPLSKSLEQPTWPKPETWSTAISVMTKIQLLPKMPPSLTIDLLTSNDRQHILSLTRHFRQRTIVWDKQDYRCTTETTQFQVKRSQK